MFTILNWKNEGSGKFSLRRHESGGTNAKQDSWLVRLRRTVKEVNQHGGIR